MPELPNPIPGTETTPPVVPTPEPAPQPPAPAPTPEPDYKEKFSASSRENEMLRERIKVLEATGKESTKEPTDSDFRTAFPDWDLVDDSQRAVYRRIYNAERAALNAQQIAAEAREERARNTSIELAISSTPALQGKEQAFRQFASRPQYKGIPADVLVKAFFGDLGTSPAPSPTPPAPAPESRPGLEPGNGGPRTPDAPKTLSAEELEILRKSDYKAYEAYIKTHEIKVEI